MKSDQKLVEIEKSLNKPSSRTTAISDTENRSVDKPSARIIDKKG